MLAWGNKVSEAFRYRVRLIAGVLEVDPSWLMATIAQETGETFSASIRHASDSASVGLIEFSPQTAAALGTSTEALAAMTPEDQLDYVCRYFFPRRSEFRSVDDLYMGLLWPAAIGLPPDAVVFDERDPHLPRRYIESRGLGLNRQGKITKAEAASSVVHMLKKGLRAPYVWAGA
jgi:hypothetical protein